MQFTDAQRRVMSYLYEAKWVDGGYDKWHHLAELDKSKLLHEDDVVVIPSLIDLGMVHYQSSDRSMILTTRGSYEVAAFAMRNKGWMK